MEYTAVIRTLGTAGEKYQQLLDSLVSQTLPPKEIIVYIAEGYPLPKETAGVERYVYVKKGMVAQRALRYDEVDTEYILFLDDDVYFPVDFVEQLYNSLIKEKADVISPNVFHNAERTKKGVFMMTVSGRMRARENDEKWGYKVMRNAGYSYNAHPEKDIYMSQTNAGPCFLCKKETFLKTHYEKELWLDMMPYAMGEDQVMFYKMYLLGMKQLTSFNSGIVHLDAGSAMQSVEKDKTRIYCDFRFKTIFWHRFIFQLEQSFLLRQWDRICIGYTFMFSLMVSLIKGRFDILRIKIHAIRDGWKFIHSKEYKDLPRIKNKDK